MKKNYRLHYMSFTRGESMNVSHTGYYLLFPLDDRSGIVAINALTLEKIMRKCRGDIHLSRVTTDIWERITRRIQEGHNDGYINVAV